jgi:glycosyltransferase involved in cell wall biosynthesis
MAEHNLPIFSRQSEVVHSEKVIIAEAIKPIRVLHIGNVANYAYNIGKILQTEGIESHVISWDYYHINAHPVWEEGSFDASSVGDHFFPKLPVPSVTGFAEPQWFVQGPRVLACLTLIAQNEGKFRRANFFRRLLRKHAQQVHDPRYRTRMAAGRQRLIELICADLLGGFEHPETLSRAMRRLPRGVMKVPSDRFDALRRTKLNHLEALRWTSLNRLDALRWTLLNRINALRWTVLYRIDALRWTLKNNISVLRWTLLNHINALRWIVLNRISALRNRISALRWIVLNRINGLRWAILNHIDALRSAMLRAGATLPRPVKQVLKKAIGWNRWVVAPQSPNLLTTLPLQSTSGKPAVIGTAAASLENACGEPITGSADIATARKPPTVESPPPTPHKAKDQGLVVLYKQMHSTSGEPADIGVSAAFSGNACGAPMTGSADLSPTPKPPTVESLPPTPFEAHVQSLITQYKQIYPERDFDPMLLRQYEHTLPLMRRLFSHYDLIIGYAIEGIWPLMAGAPYVAYEFGTIRNIPFADTPMGRLAAVTYLNAEQTVVTNSDNEAPAKRLGRPFFFLPHVVNEGGLLTPHEAEAAREEFIAEYGGDFIVFHPSRQHWDEARDTNWDKGNDHLWRGFARLVLNDAPNARCIAVAWGEQLARSKALIEELGITENVVWIDPQPHIAMMRYICLCDVVCDQFTIPTFGGIPPKAFHAGKPVVTSFDPGLHHWCFDELPPLIPANSAQLVYQALARLYADREFSSALGRKGADWYRRKNSNARVREVLLANLKGLQRTTVDPTRQS